MRSLRSAVVALLLVALSAGAAQAQSNRAQRLADVLGLEEQLEASKQMIMAVAARQFAQVLDQLRAAQMPDEFVDVAKQYADDYVRSVSEAWSSEEGAKIYVDALLQGMTETELDDAIAYYSTAQGQRAKAIIANADAKLDEYIASKVEPVKRAQMNRFLAKVLELRKKRASAAQTQPSAPSKAP